MHICLEHLVTVANVISVRASLTYSEIYDNYDNYDLFQDSPNEQVILWDVIRTFPGHDFFKDAGGQGQESLYRICKVTYIIVDSYHSKC